MNVRYLLLLLAAIIALHWIGLASSAQAAVKLPALFSASMVLQRDVPIPIWGTAEPGESLKVSPDGKDVQATADAKGNWRAQLAPHQVAKDLTLAISGKNILSFNDVAMGEVWLCSARSNIGFAMSQVKNAATEIVAAQNPDLHIFSVRKIAI